MRRDVLLSVLLQDELEAVGDRVELIKDVPYYYAPVCLAFYCERDEDVLRACVASVQSRMMPVQRFMHSGLHMRVIEMETRPERGMLFLGPPSIANSDADLTVVQMCSKSIVHV